MVEDLMMGVEVEEDYHLESLEASHQRMQVLEQFWQIDVHLFCLLSFLK